MTSSPPHLLRYPFGSPLRFPFATGRHLAAARTMAGLTQAKLADLAGVHVNSLKRLERMKSISGSDYSVWHIFNALKDKGIIAEIRPWPLVRMTGIRGC